MKMVTKKLELFFILILISGCAITVGTKSEKKVKRKSYTYHYVRKGENLFRISKYYYGAKTVKEIKEGIERIKRANNLKDENLYVGEKLLIPGTYKKQPSYPLLPPKEVVKKEKYETPISKEEKRPDIPQPIIKDKAFIWPVKGKIICKYGELGNKGLDIMVEPGSDVLAASGGEVVYAGITRKYNETIIIKHTEQLYTIYAHDIEILVKKGDKVNKGEVIGKIKGETQRKRYIHFEIRINSQPVNPLIYLPERNERKN